MPVAEPRSRTLAARALRKGGRIAGRIARQIAPRDPVYVFHHLPKCGGTSLLSVLGEQFHLVRDYSHEVLKNYPEKQDLRRLRSRDCLCGHFEIDGYFLRQRYPEVFTDPRYRLITFVRDPLEVQLSLYRYEAKCERPQYPDLETQLAHSRNYLAGRFPVTEANYREVIDQYFFVGVLEEDRRSVAALAALIGRPFAPLPWSNRSRDDASRGRGEEAFSPERRERFREENALDYLLYDYCVEKFHETARQVGVA